MLCQGIPLKDWFAHSQPRLPWRKCSTLCGWAALLSPFPITRAALVCWWWGGLRTDIASAPQHRRWMLLLHFATRHILLSRYGWWCRMVPVYKLGGASSEYLHYQNNPPPCTCCSNSSCLEHCTANAIQLRSQKQPQAPCMAVRGSFLFPKETKPLLHAL